MTVDVQITETRITTRQFTLEPGEQFTIRKPGTKGIGVQVTHVRVMWSRTSSSTGLDHTNRFISWSGLQLDKAGAPTATRVNSGEAKDETDPPEVVRLIAAYE